MYGFLRWLRQLLGGLGFPAGSRVEEQPLRSELFSAEQMERYGPTLAAAHQLTSSRVQDQLLPRLTANETILINVCKRLTTVASANHRISPPGAWLLDNFHLIEEQIGTAKRHLSRDYSRELPGLAAGPSAGLPRVYDIALETVSHGDGRRQSDPFCRDLSVCNSAEAR
jgi:hypothetical protein